jgi:hypothetical protein
MDFGNVTLAYVGGEPSGCNLLNLTKKIDLAGKP